MKSTFPVVALRFDALYFRVMQAPYEISLIQMFLLFFLMMGPMRLLNIFVTNTQELTIAQIKTLSLQAVAYAALVITLAGLAGKFILQDWYIPQPMFTIAAGAVFAVSALRILRGSQEEKIPRSTTPIRGPFVATTMIITPFGISTLILLLCLNTDVFGLIKIFGALLAVLLIDFMTMYFVRSIVRVIALNAFKIPSVILAVTQTVLALTLIYQGFLALFPR